MKLLLHIVAFVLLSGVAGFAQEDSVFTVSGRVVLKGFSIPLPGASVKLLKHKKPSYSDIDGNFSIHKVKAGEYTISVSAIGYNAFDTIIKVFDRNVADITLSPIADCDQLNQQTAYNYIKGDSVKLFLASGLLLQIDSTRDLKDVTPISTIFEERYRIQYFDFYCNQPLWDCILQYNYAVFKHLDQKYGKGWRTEIRPDIIGFKEYIAEN